MERSLRLNLAAYSLPCSWQYELHMDVRVDKDMTHDSWFMVRLELCNKWQKSYACTLPLVPFTIPLLHTTREFMLDPRIWLGRLMCGQSGNCTINKSSQLSYIDMGMNKSTVKSQSSWSLLFGQVGAILIHDLIMWSKKRQTLPRPQSNPYEVAKYSLSPLSL